MRACPRAFPLAALLLGLLLAACNSAPPPAPPATLLPPTATKAATATGTPAAAATPVPATLPAPQPASEPTELPPGWQRQANDELSIAIPPGWRAVDLTAAQAQAAFDTLEASDPVLAGILGGPEALEGAALWAFGPTLPGSQQAGFVENLNARRSPLGAQRVTDIRQVIDVLLPEYEKMGLSVTSTDPTLRIAGFPAARITYTLATSDPDAKLPELRGRQFIVATDDDLWILSYSTTPEREGELAAQFETSARSFQPK